MNQTTSLRGSKENKQGEMIVEKEIGLLKERVQYLEKKQRESEVNFENITKETIVMLKSCEQEKREEELTEFCKKKEMEVKKSQAPKENSLTVKCTKKELREALDETSTL